MRKVFKYTITAECGIEMPIGAEILSCGEQGADLVIWALVNPDEPEKEIRDFVAVYTGHPLPELDMNFIGTVQSRDSILVYHIFERLE